MDKEAKKETNMDMDTNFRFSDAVAAAKELFSDLELTELTLRDGDLELTMKKSAPAVAAAPSPVMMPVQGIPVGSALQTEPAASATPSSHQAALINCHEVKSPLVGVLYLSPAPGADPFVSVGDHVSKGDVLCIVEAMKMMNEIVSEYDGTVLDICAGSEDLVEYGQVLFKIG